MVYGDGWFAGLDFCIALALFFCVFSALYSGGFLLVLWLLELIPYFSLTLYLYVCVCVCVRVVC